MFLDIKNNELIFSGVEDRREFTGDMQAMKNVKHRLYKNKYYFSLAHFNVIRRVLSDKYRGKISFSIPYMKFAERFVLDKNPVKIEHHPAYCTIKGAGIPWEEIIPATSYFDKKAKNASSYGKTWSGYTHLFNVTEGTFPAGLIDRIVMILMKHQIPFDVQRQFEYPKPSLSLTPTFSFTPTEDQEKAMEALFKANTGIGKLPTGFGKTSYVAASLIAKKGVKSLFLANQRVLTDDAKADFDQVFEGNDVKIGMIGDGRFEPGDITVASIQTIAAALKPPTIKELQLAHYERDLEKERMRFFTDPEEKKTAEKEYNKHARRIESIERRRKRHDDIIPFLKEVELFIVDEAQVLGTDQWNSFLYACPAAYRYTLSATPTRTDGGGIQIVAATGETRYSSSAEEQIAKGRLSEFTGHFVKFDHKVDRNEVKDLKMDYHQAYDVFIVRNERRNQHLCAKVVEWAQNHSVLALVTRKEHGNIVKEMLEQMGLPQEASHYIDGDTPKKLRKDTIADFRDGKFPVLIGTSIFDVGFNAKNASKIVRFNAGGSEVREPQRAGRTVRLREDGSAGDSYDIIDLNCPFFESQGWKRMKFLKEEFGANRVKVHPIVIDGELDVVGLQSIVEALPAETDRQRGYDIIKSLQFGLQEINEDNAPEYDTEEMEGNLQDLLAELTLPE